MRALPDKLISKMAPEQRKAMGLKTMQEIESRQAIKSEKDLQRQCIAMLRLRGVFVIVSRMDRRTSNQVGTPDLLFSLMGQDASRGRPCAFECKLPGCKPTPEQENVMAQMASNGWTVRVIHSVEQMRDELNTLEKL